MPVTGTLDELVTSVASELMAVDSGSQVDALGRVLRTLVEYFEVDLSFLRHNDHERHVTRLIAEWPPRPDVPDPDPLGEIAFATADPVFAATEHLADTMITRPDLASADYQERVTQASGVQGVSSATVPLRSRDVTSGVLGFVKFGDRRWEPAEINALNAIASLLAQMQARTEAEDQLRYLAYHDELTGLLNRRALLDHLDERLHSDDGDAVSVLFLDLDRLKSMNDFLGHAAGDRFLRAIAERLRAACPDDVVSRLGGDEIVVVLGGAADGRRARAVAAWLQGIVNEPVRVGDEEVSRRVSIGVATGRPGEITVSLLLGHADHAVMAAKALGGNGIVMFTEQMRLNNEVRTDIELHLRDAIRNGDLVLHYQPEVDLRTGTLLGAEALVRWNHPTRGLLQPDSFIEVAEATNLSGELGRWVLDTACEQLAQWQAEFGATGFCLRVNVSPAQLITGDFTAQVRNALQRFGLDGQYLCLEITEVAVVRDVVSARETLQELKKLGVHLAIDDFGTGYSSLAQLKTLPVDALKIDRGFVHELGHNLDDLAIVRSIVSLAGSFGLETVAEGVDTTGAVCTLVGLGCFRAQGYLIGKPMPAEQLRSVIEDGGVRPEILGQSSDDPPAPGLRRVS